MRKSIKKIFLLFGFISWVFAASPLMLHLKSYRVVLEKDEGKIVEKLLPAGEVSPGDVVEWILTAKNVSEAVLENVILTIPIPSNTFYLEGTAVPLKMGEDQIIMPLFSYDGVNFSRPPLKRIVKIKTNGRITTKVLLVPPKSYTHVRWIVPKLDPGQEIQVRLRTVVR